MSETAPYEPPTATCDCCGRGWQATPQCRPWDLHPWVRVDLGRTLCPECNTSIRRLRIALELAGLPRKD